MISYLGGHPVDGDGQGITTFGVPVGGKLFDRPVGDLLAALNFEVNRVELLSVSHILHAARHLHAVPSQSTI